MAIRLPSLHVPILATKVAALEARLREADLYPRFGRTMEWDTAAGDAVLRAAGGMTATLDGRPLVYGKRKQEGEADFANPHFVASGGAAWADRGLVSG